MPITEIMSEMSATVCEVLVAVDDLVETGTTLLVVESMKMEIPVESPISGRVEELRVSEGDSVGPSQVLVLIEEKGTG